ncbi:MFS_1 domain-containing protein [Rhizoctonia solani AG-1 IA]|uniref:MFS_1 domain-containing protein n=1 Tax=Thanatephorus cucumeris (strain AG1-IA) TaxID=983506 RepID=L8WIE3_THACA|nr:MFS_1 domain-containing protein [Rhizoctonia solani AG-1 IA]
MRFALFKRWRRAVPCVPSSFPCESCLTLFLQFSGAHWLLGSWYKDSELGKPIPACPTGSALFACFAQIGSLFSGFMQGAIYTSLHKKLGKEGWQWTFIIGQPPLHTSPWPTHSHSTTDGLIALLIALYGLIIFPNTPQTTSAFYLSPEEKQLARTRLTPRPRAKFTKREVKKIFAGWRYWMFSALFVVTSQDNRARNRYGTNGIVSIWLTTDHIAGPPKNSYYALGLIAVAIATTILAGLATDRWGHRWRVNLFMGVILLISAIMLLVWDIPLGARGCGYAGQGTNFAWYVPLIHNHACADFVAAGQMKLRGLISNGLTRELGGNLRRVVPIRRKSAQEMDQGGSKMKERTGNRGRVVGRTKRTGRYRQWWRSVLYVLPISAHIAVH